jgi:SAM-dependent methyltransferase
MTDYNDEPFARRYLEAQEEFYRDREEIPTNLILQNIEFSIHERSNLRLMDLGCGSGNMVPRLIRKDLRGEYIGIDKSEYMLPKQRFGIARDIVNGATQDYENSMYYRFYQIDFDGGLPFKYGSIDLVLSRYALHYSRDLPGLFSEIGRVLVPKGRVVAVVAHPVLGLELKKERVYWKPEEVEVSLYKGRVRIVEPTHTFQDYWSAFENNGFRVVKQEESLNNANETGLNVPDYYFFVLKRE